MGYRMDQRRCRACGRETLHWCEQGVLAPPHGWKAPLVNFSRLIRSAVVWRWHCLECEHPWRATLLRQPTRAGGHAAPPDAP